MRTEGVMKRLEVANPVDASDLSAGPRGVQVGGASLGSCCQRLQ
jgi:hypothetical protein